MPNFITKNDSARIQSTQARGGKDMSSAGFAAHAQSAADRNVNSGRGAAAGQGKASGGGGASSGTGAGAGSAVRPAGRT